MFRFTIRELVLVTVVAGALVPWWLEHRECKRLLNENKSYDNSLKMVMGLLEEALQKVPSTAYPVYGDGKDLHIKELSADVEAPFENPPTRQ